MNSLAQLVSDLDLDEAMVLRRLIDEGLIPRDCWTVKQVPEPACRDAIDLVMKVLLKGVN